MELEENQINSLCQKIYTVFPSSEQLNEILNQNEYLKGKLVLEINYNNLPENDYLNKLKKYNQNNLNSNKEIKLLVLEAYHTKGIDYEKEYENIFFSINSNKSIVFDIKKDKVVVKKTQDFHDATLNREYQICHFLGHGNEGIFLNSEKITPESLKSYFQYRDKCKCVVFNACSSGEAAKQVSEHINYVIGMSQPINDDIAIKFAGGFYNGLQNGINNNKDIYLTGFREGILAISGDKNSQESIPVLYINYKRAILNLIKQLDAENKIEYFLKLLCTDYPTNKLFNQLYSIYSYPIQQPDVFELVKIVKEIKDWDLVQSAYRETLPENATVDNSELNNPQNISNIIDFLREKYPFVRGNVPSILEFSKNLASKFAENSQEYPRIKSWVAEISSKLNISIDVQPKIESSLTTNPKTCLLIIISPEEANFRLEAEYILDENQKSPPQPFDFQKQVNNDYETENGVICSEKEIPLVLEKIINSFMSNFKEKILKPIIEIFLPYKYLGRNLDHEWRIQDDFKEKIAIVQEYNIVFYPLERCTGRNSYFSFKESWTKFKTLLESDADTKSIVARLEIIQTVGKDYRILGKRLKEKIGVKLMSPFPVKEQEQEYFWRAVLSGGIPLAFWTRYHPQKQINLDDIDNYLAKEYLENDFANFINEMCNLRQDAYNDEENQEDNLGYHLGFLCDNLNRIYRSQLLQSFL